MKSHLPHYWNMLLQLQLAFEEVTFLTNKITIWTNRMLNFIAAALGVGKSKLPKEVGLRLSKEHFKKDTLCLPLFA